MLVTPISSLPTCSSTATGIDARALTIDPQPLSGDVVNLTTSQPVAASHAVVLGESTAIASGPHASA